MTNKERTIIVLFMKTFPKFLKLSKAAQGRGATIYINKDLVDKMGWKEGEEVLSVFYDEEKGEVLLKAFSEEE